MLEKGCWENEKSIVERWIWEAEDGGRWEGLGAFREEKEDVRERMLGGEREEYNVEVDMGGRVRWEMVGRRLYRSWRRGGWWR